MSSEKGRIEADIAEAKANKKDALKAGREALAGDIEKRLLALQEDLKNERQRLNYERDLELAKAQHKDANSVSEFNVFGHGIGLPQLAFGVLGLGGAVIAGGRFYVAKHHQRATSKSFNSLLVACNENLSKIDFSLLPRGNMTVGIDNKPIHKLNLRDAFKAVALVGPNRSGKTMFLSNVILNDMFPWWYRIFPPRGLFLTGSQDSPNVKDWLKRQIATSEKEHPFVALADLLPQRRRKQWVRLYLHRTFKGFLPRFLKPQPAIIVIDQAEELLRAYRAVFLVEFYNIVKWARDKDLFILVLVINSDNAVKALELMHGGNMFSFIRAPKVSRDAVVSEYGEKFANIFDECDSCIGVALDYVRGEDRREDMSARDYAKMKMKQYISDNCLTDEITKEEFNKAREHFKK